MKDLIVSQMKAIFEEKVAEAIKNSPMDNSFTSNITKSTNIVDAITNFRMQLVKATAFQDLAQIGMTEDEMYRTIREVSDEIWDKYVK